MIQTSRRSFLVGAAATLITAPAIVRAASLMPVKAMPTLLTLEDYERRILAPMYEQLADITRRAFVPRLHVQLYVASPALNSLVEME